MSICGRKIPESLLDLPPDEHTKLVNSVNSFLAENPDANGLPWVALYLSTKQINIVFRPANQ